MASVWHVIAGHLSVCPSVCLSNQITHEALQQSHNFFKSLSYGLALTLTDMNGPQVVCQLKWSHCTSSCDGFCDFTHRSSGVCVPVCVCVWKVNTVSSSAAVRTLSLFSSQRSVWKAYCCANHGVTERAVPPQPTPAPLLNLRVWTVICTMVCTAQTLPVSGTSFFVVCCVKQLQNAVQKVNGSQWQKARTAAV